MSPPRLARPVAVVLVSALLAPALLSAPAAAFTSEGGWVVNDPIPFEPFSTSSYTVLASNHSGGALAVAYAFLNGTSHLFAFPFYLNRGWSPGTLINDTSLNIASEPAAALGDDGSAVAAWVLDPGDNSSIGASHYAPGVGWSGSKTLSASLGATDPRAAVGTDGTAIVTWTENVSGTWRGRYALHPTGQTWSSPADLDPTAGGYGIFVDAGPGGTFVASWVSIFGNESVARASRYSPAAGWSAAVNVSAPSAAFGVYRHIVNAAPDGGAFVTWTESDGFYQNLSARHMTAAGTWEAIRPLVNSGMATSFASCVVDAGGNATFAWNGFETGDYAPAAVRYEVGAGWGARTTLGSLDFAAIYTPPVLAAGDDGVVMAIWGFPDTHGNTESFARFVPGLGWSAPAPISGSTVYPEGDAAGLGGGHVLYVPRFAFGWSALFDRTPPPLSVADPEPGAVFGYPVIDVTGTTEPGAHVVVNGVGATVGTNGAWTVRVALGAGVNDLRVVVSDEAGNTVYDNRTVTFNDPVPGLIAALAGAQANASAAQAAAAAAEANVSAAQAAAAAAQANLNATNAEVADLQAALDLSVGEQVRLQAQINTLNQTITNMRAPAPSSDGLALTVAVLGVALGAGGLAVGMMAQRRGRLTAKDPYPDEKDAK